VGKVQGWQFLLALFGFKNVNKAEAAFIKFLSKGTGQNRGPYWLKKRGWEHRQCADGLWWFFHPKHGGPYCYTEAFYREM